MPTLFRIDLRFSGSFLEQPDGEVTGFSENSAGLTFDLNEDSVLEDLPPGLAALGVAAEGLSWVEDEKAVFQAPSGFDAQASATSGWPRFTHGATSTRFIRVDAEASDALLMAIHNAFAMASVTLYWNDLAAYDDSPKVTVNAIQSLNDAVDPRSPHERRAEGLIAAINSAVNASEEG